MIKQRPHPMRRQFYRLLWLQTVIVLCAATITWLLANSLIALSIVAGGFICIIPNALFTQRYFAKSGASAAKNVLTTLYCGEVLKLIATMALLGISIKVLSLNAAAVVISFIATYQLLWLAPLFCKPMVKRSMA